jgi:hypothetical protein
MKVGPALNASATFSASDAGWSWVAVWADAVAVIVASARNAISFISEISTRNSCFAPTPLPAPDCRKLAKGQSVVLMWVTMRGECRSFSNADPSAGNQAADCLQAAFLNEARPNRRNVGLRVAQRGRRRVDRVGAEDEVVLVRHGRAEKRIQRPAARSPASRARRLQGFGPPQQIVDHRRGRRPQLGQSSLDIAALVVSPQGGDRDVDR